MTLAGILGGCEAWETGDIQQEKSLRELGVVTGVGERQGRI